ncbi:MAG: ShlB/FhaC/HecB family hemolysin secretion/activation protein [Oculatellaceae cyanobacterium bins.114]|nr:ShlB/FhaC/HecB family hemolysin secretion/activation protein [Oculatellaceae cyanobacterium bins.114]
MPNCQCYKWHRVGWLVILGSVCAVASDVIQHRGAIAQALPNLDSSLGSEVAQVPPVPQRDTLPPPIEPLSLPETPAPADELLNTPPPEVTEPVAPAPEPAPSEETVFVERFEIVGSTVFGEADWAALTAPYLNRNLTFAELLQVRSAVTQLYVSRGYINSGAFLPPQEPVNGVVTIQVMEGRVEAINVTGTRRLNSSYVRDRLAIATMTPFNVQRLLERLQLLQIDPQINNISAELSSSVRPGSSVLDVEVTESDPFSLQLVTNNGRSPSVGSWRRQIQANQANLLGQGDVLSVSYANTSGSDALDASYVIPLNPRNGTLILNYGIAQSDVVEEPFNALDIQSDSRYYEVGFRQPLLQTPTQEFALSLTASRRESQSEFLEDLIGEPVPFPGVGADAEGRTRVSVLRFTQEWTQQRSQEVFAARSQFSLGLDALDSTVNEVGPDSRFLAWRGQTQWVRLLAPDTLLLVRGEVQLADAPLVSLEQFGLGGQTSVRGYRQDFLLTDNGALASAEVRLPILRSRPLDGVLHLIPFMDVGVGWNAEGENPDPNGLISVGLGLQWRQSDRLTARLDWGIPLVSVDTRERTWQESGVYFSIVYTPF